MSKVHPKNKLVRITNPKNLVLKYSGAMSTKGVLFAAWIGAISATGCCKACSAVSGIAKEIGGPEASDGEPLVKARVEQDKELRKRICGVETRQLTDLVVKKNSDGHYSIQGTPVEKPRAKLPSTKPDGGAPGKPLVDGQQVVVCAAVVSLLWDVKEGSGRTTWSIQKVSVEEITTPGSEYKRPPSRDWD